MTLTGGFDVVPLIFEKTLEEKVKVKLRPPAPPPGPSGPMPLRLSPLAEWVEETAKGMRRPRRSEPRPCVLAAMAMAVADRGGRPTPESCAKWMPDGEPPPIAAELKAFGGKPGAIRAMEGGLAFPGGLGGWSPGFLAGLCDARALNVMAGGWMHVPWRAPAWLAAALEARPFALSCGRRGRRLRVWGCPLSRWGVSGPSPERAAGCLAGAREFRDGGRLWLLVPARCGGVLSWAGVRSTVCAAGLLVSPFFAALLASLAPPEASGWMAGRRVRAGMCPEVAGAFWEMCFGDAMGVPYRKGGVMAPKGALPYLPRGDGLTAVGWGKRRCRGLAQELWPAGVAGWMRRCGVWWVRRAGLVVED